MSFQGNGWPRHIGRQDRCGTGPGAEEPRLVPWRPPPAYHPSLALCRQCARFSQAPLESAATVGACLLELLVGLRHLRPGELRARDDPGEVVRRPEEVVRRGSSPVAISFARWRFGEPRPPCRAAPMTQRPRLAPYGRPLRCAAGARSLLPMLLFRAVNLIHELMDRGVVAAPGPGRQTRCHYQGHEQGRGGTSLNFGFITAWLLMTCRRAT